VEVDLDLAGRSFIEGKESLELDALDDARYVAMHLTRGGKRAFHVTGGWKHDLVGDTMIAEIIEPAGTQVESPGGDRRLDLQAKRGGAVVAHSLAPGAARPPPVDLRLEGIARHRDRTPSGRKHAPPGDVGSGGIDPPQCA